jgi:nucleotide-binding universal stress UspA family protein
MKKILVPTDFSDNAFNALQYAARVANLFGSEITLLHTYRVHSSTGMLISVEPLTMEQAEKEMHATALKIEPFLEKGTRLETKIVRGDAISIISDVADISNYDIIIMGTQGATGLKEILIGSVTNGVIKTTRTPVLAVPSEYEYRPPKCIIFAVDEEGVPSPKVSEPLVVLAGKFGAGIRVYHKDTGESDPGIDPKIDVYLEGVEHSFHYELDSEILTKSITAFAEDCNADMLCLIRRTRGFLEEIFHVSVTSKTALHTHIPLLVLQEN